MTKGYPFDTNNDSKTDTLSADEVLAIRCGETDAEVVCDDLISIDDDCTINRLIYTHSGAYFETTYHNTVSLDDGSYYEGDFEFWEVEPYIKEVVDYRPVNHDC